MSKLGIGPELAQVPRQGICPGRFESGEGLGAENSLPLGIPIFPLSPNAMCKAAQPHTESSPRSLVACRKLGPPGPGLVTMRTEANPALGSSTLALSLTRPWGPVSGTADWGPPLLVHRAEEGLVIPVAAPVLRLQLLLCGEVQHVEGCKSLGGGVGRGNRSRGAWLWHLPKVVTITPCSMSFHDSWSGDSAACRHVGGHCELGHTVGGPG